MVRSPGACREVSVGECPGQAAMQSGRSESNVGLMSAREPHQK
ncbi:MAG: hypothetical protein ACPG4T_05680 [Nannocystaceae bacterium]